jgi:hypothetical protein
MRLAITSRNKLTELRIEDVFDTVRRVIWRATAPSSPPEEAQLRPDLLGCWSIWNARVTDPANCEDVPLKKYFGFPGN